MFPQLGRIDRTFANRDLCEEVVDINAGPR
jgi:hypothetical protein